ncbi:MAG TPA: hypothetical protein PLF77_04595 [Smithella sp.]|nr:hypothetical protein [Smithella sp.]
MRYAGIGPGQKFKRALLLDLYRSGEVYTHGEGPGADVDVRQTVFDFSNDPDPEGMFPSCASCHSINDLHLVEITEGEKKATILCVDCRSKKISTFDTSIPLPMVSRTNLKQFIETKGIKKIDKSVNEYKNLLDAEFEDKWNAYKKGKPEQQELIKKHGSLI